MVRSNSPGQRLVEDEQVDVVDAELAGALVEGVEGLVVAVVADPHLGLDEHVVAVDAAAADGVADAAFVAVGGGGVDVAVADAQGLSTATSVSSGGVWKTPKPMAGIVTPLLRVNVVVVMWLLSSWSSRRGLIGW